MELHSRIRRSFCITTHHVTEETFLEKRMRWAFHYYNVLEVSHCATWHWWWPFIGGAQCGKKRSFLLDLATVVMFQPNILMWLLRAVLSTVKRVIHIPVKKCTKRMLWIAFDGRQFLLPLWVNWSKSFEGKWWKIFRERQNSMTPLKLVSILMMKLKTYQKAFKYQIVKPTTI